MDRSVRTPTRWLEDGAIRLPAARPGCTGVAAIAGLQALILSLLADQLTAFTVTGFLDALLAVVVISAVVGLVWPYAYGLAARFHALLFPVVMLVLTGVIGALIDHLLPGVRVDSFWASLLIVLVIFASSTLLGMVVGREDDAEYERFVTDSIRRVYRNVPHSEEPGVIFFEIDGLAEPVLREAIAVGRMPTLRRWLETGSHRLLTWEPDLSSQTSASQAGILLGDNHEIPAFRWYDREQGRLVVSSSFADAGAIEHRLSRKVGLLVATGASRLNMMSGDAPDCLFTFSTFRASERKPSSRAYYAYFTNPYNLARVLTLFVADVVAELWYAWRQRRRGGPRVPRGGHYPIARATTTSLMLELSLYMAIRDVLRGVPVVYTTAFAYDEVAHHSGIRAPDAFNTLGRIDRDLRRLARAAAKAPRPYHLVVLSDHGQSEGATFKARYGRSLRQVVEELAEAGPVAGTATGDEHLGAISLVVSEAMNRDDRTGRVLQRLLRDRAEDGVVRVGPSAHELTASEPEAEGDKRRPAAMADEPAPQVAVLASGNLGLVYFTERADRMTFEELTDASPKLLAGLATHPGIAFVMVDSSEHGAMAIGAEGIYYLERDEIAGKDPLAPFGPNAAGHLRRTNGFRNAPDILVNSLFDPQIGETAAFEELLGNHGGLGGPQTLPFVLYPAVFEPPAEPVVGAAAVHRLFCGWLSQVRGRPHPALLAAGTSPVAADEAPAAAPSASSAGQPAASV